MEPTLSTGAGSKAELPGVAAPVIELVGPAGCGKSTLAQALGRKRPKFRLEFPRSGVWQAAFLVQDSPIWLGEFLRTGDRAKIPSRSDLRSMAYLRLWARKFPGPVGRGIPLFDHGPVFRLASLKYLGPLISKSPAMERWWLDRAMEWASRLTLIVRLDAPDQVLHERIQGRDQAHLLQGANLDRSRELLNKYRRAYDEVLGLLSENGSVRVIEISSGNQTPDRIADAVLSCLDRPAGHRD